MNELASYVALGFRHITDPGGLDHVLFLIVLAVVYRARDWRAATWVVTAFTVGHSITLALAALHVVAFPIAVIEFLIPLTIVVTALENLREREPGPAGTTRLRLRALLAGVFGLIHGAGFAGYLDSLLIDQPLVPLLGFNIGIEIGQVVVLTAAVVAMTLLDRLLTQARLGFGRFTPLRIRITMVSAVVAVVASRWAIMRSPW